MTVSRTILALSLALAGSQAAAADPYFRFPTIRGDTIVAAGAILPLTQFPVSDRSIGTRHRAALGLSEETDALVIVVSEETSTVSVAVRGRLERGVGRERLLEVLASRGAEMIAGPA